MSGMTGGSYGGSPGYSTDYAATGGLYGTPSYPGGYSGSYGGGGGYNPFSSFKPTGGPTPSPGPMSSVSGQPLQGGSLIPGMLPQSPAPQQMSLPMVLQALLQSTAKGYGG